MALKEPFLLWSINGKIYLSDEKGEKMNKNFKKKMMNYVHKGYALYDSDLSQKYFVESINEIISLHDVFKQTLKNNGLVEEETSYEYGEIHCLDQISLADELKGMKEKPLKQAADFKLIYFHGNLRGFYYRFNGFLFDERSVKHVIASIERQYFKGKFKQSSSSYVKWLENNHQSFDLAFKSGQYQSINKLLTFDESLTKRIKQYNKDHNLTMIQFFTGILGIYYKQGRHKDITFMTNYFQDDANIIGNTESKKSYHLKKNPNLLTHDFIKEAWIEKDKYSHIRIDVKYNFKDLKASVTTLPSIDVPYEIAFVIDEKDWEIALEIVAQKYRFKKDDLFLMLNKIRSVVFNVLEEDNKISEISLLTKKEEEIALSYAEPRVTKKQTSIYDQFISKSKEKANKPAIVTDKIVNFDKLAATVVKMKKALDRSAKGKMVSLDGLSDVEKIAAFIAIDGAGATYTDAKGLIIKKGLFGYKVSGNSIAGNGLYNVKGHEISRKGYLTYNEFVKQYFRLSFEDVGPMNEWLKFGIPVLLVGGYISSKTDITICTMNASDLKLSDTLKHVVTNDKFVEGKYNYKLHFGLSFDQTVPLSFVGPIKQGKLSNLKPVDGLGFVILNKYKRATQAFEKGNVHVFGPCATMVESEDINVLGKTIQNVTALNNKASWFLDETLRF